MAELLRTNRLLVRDWSAADAEAALKLFGHEALRRWAPEIADLPGIPDGPDATVMQEVLQRWAAEQRDMSPGTGRWALVALDGGALVGAISLLPMPVPEADVEMECQLAPEYWGRGYITEAAWALAQWAFEHSLVELFALVPPDNTRAAATAQRIGMEWVGESDKYHGQSLQVFRLRPDDLANAVRNRPG
ncbi:MAG TPA: GNAT family N-acetyltransferase [Pseudonocardiaceae bacterium]|jgi:ribosomal-protein-alanine N-acetyltransferase|nr:GNAT family N-acetyltransferase [Pseudonocardiaceae bacterium]